MIIIECPYCKKEFYDYCGENAVQNEDGSLKDYDRYYKCPECGSEIDLLNDYLPVQE